MRILVIGGAGKVGSLVLPYLAANHAVRVYDLRPPVPLEAGTPLEYTEGDVCDPEALGRAMVDREAVLFMAMGHYEPTSNPWGSITAQHASFDVSVKGMYFTLDVARQAGIRHAVYTSSLSVYQAMTWGRGESRYYIDEDMPPDAQPIYGFTKRLGEEVCRNATREWGMSINVLRLCLPVSDAEWQAKAQPGEPTIRTAASDLARALEAALGFRAGFQAFHISGDYEEKKMRMTRAKQLLGWEPLARPESVTDNSR